VIELKLCQLWFLLGQLLIAMGVKVFSVREESALMFSILVLMELLQLLVILDVVSLRVAKHLREKNNL
jgi:hypothetical protein